MADEVLSQAELETLARWLWRRPGTSLSDPPAAAGASRRSAHECSPYDFRRTVDAPAANCSIADAMHEGLARRLAAALSALLRTHGRRQAGARRTARPTASFVAAIGQPDVPEHRARRRRSTDSWLLDIDPLDPVIR